MDILRDYLDSYLAREFGHLETFSDYKLNADKSLS